MSHGKLRLNLADLRLKSFETTTPTSDVRGTVRGMDSECTECTGCTACTLSEPACSGLTECSFITLCVYSCGGPSGWNASTTDGGGC